MRPRSLEMQKKNCPATFHQRILQKTATENFFKDSCCWEVGNLFFFFVGPKNSMEAQQMSILNPTNNLEGSKFFSLPKRWRVNFQNQMNLTKCFEISFPEVIQRPYFYMILGDPNANNEPNGCENLSDSVRNPTPVRRRRSPQVLMVLQDGRLKKRSFFGVVSLGGNGGLVQMMIPFSKGCGFFKRSCCWYFCRELGLKVGWTFWTAKNWMVQRIQWISCTTMAGGLLERNVNYEWAP